MPQNPSGGMSPQTMFRADLLRGERILVTGGGTGLGYVLYRQAMLRRQQGAT